jgi:hypothetical protein
MCIVLRTKRDDDGYVEGFEAIGPFTAWLFAQQYIDAHPDDGAMFIMKLQHG